MGTPRYRFAPSPTGPIHLGNLRTALFNWLAAKSTGGKFILRIEDTDPERSKPEYERAIYDALQFLGLDWDEGPDIGGDYGPYRQSERGELYENALSQLLDKDAAYPCFCTEEELAKKKEDAIKRGRPYRYDRVCYANREQSRERMEKGESCSIRFKMPDDDIAVDDLIRGKTVFARADHSDFIIRRSDGTFTYNFTCTVDDAAMGITCVLRGEDHLSNTPKQIAIFHAMDESPPEFAHVPLIHSPEGGKLKKRELGEGLDWVCEQVYLNTALFNYLSLLGWSHPEGIEVLSREEIIAAFSISRISKSPSKFDIDKLNWLNEQHMRKMDADTLYNAAMEYVSNDDFKALDDELGKDKFKAVMFELLDGYSNLKEIPGKFAIFREGPYRDELKGNVALLMDDRAKNINLLNAFRDEVLAVDDVAGGDTAMHLMKSAGGKVSCKGKSLYHPLRVALTGRGEGFELKRFLPLLGRDLILKRTEYVLDILKRSEV